MVPLGAIAVLLLVLAAPPPARDGAGLGPPSRFQVAERDDLALLAEWMDRYRKIGGSRLGPGWEGDLRELVAGLRLELGRTADVERRRAVLMGLVDLAGITGGEDGESGPGEATRRVRRVGLDALDLELRRDEHLGRWITEEILARPQPPERRLAALAALSGRHLSGTLLGVLTAARSEDPRVAAAALEALSGWPDENVHRFFAARLEQAFEARDWETVRAVRAHLARLDEPPAGAARLDLAGVLGRRLGLADWRPAVLAAEVTGALDAPLAVPLLIGGLEAWIALRAAGQGSRRVEGEILDELERRSGRRLGAHPERWRAWWRAWREGLVEQDPGEASATSVTFFGIRPRSDRITFVIDRSGSMQEEFGTSAASRYERASKQMLQLLEHMGEETRFSVVVFGDRPRSWSRDLRPATAANLGAARRWLATHPPDGGTYLHAALEEALHVRRDGRPDLERLEADTVVVLCDGQTTEGTGWVAPFLAGPNAEALIAFHCVQIGMEGDGTLEALATGTGGQFVRILH